MAEKFSIKTVIEHYTGAPLPDRGGWNKLCCPVHSENNPSASFNEDLGKLNCFGCSFHGDALDLIGLKEGTDNYKEQVTHAEQITGTTAVGGPGFSSAPQSRRLPARITDSGAARDSAVRTVPGAAPPGRRRARRIVD